MPYFKLMSAINLYVAVDWQADREIERRGEGGWVTRQKKKKRNEWASGRPDKKGRKSREENKKEKRDN